uniref:Negative elongation factor D n=1 Tax=Syphacia muris TaxID=451379 RepID=A0A0N5AQ95_9BILA
MEVSADALDGYVVERLKNGDYASIEKRLAFVDEKTISNAYLSIFPELFRRYIEVTDISEDSDGEKSLVNAINCITRTVDVKDRYMSVLEVYQDARSTKPLLFLCKQLNEILSPDKETDLKRDLLGELRDDILPYFLSQLRQLAKENDAGQHADILQISGLFIEVFRNSYCKSFFLLDDLLTYVLSYLPIVGKKIITVLKKYISVFDQNVDIQPKPILLSVSLHDWSLEVSFSWLIPFLVYSPIYNFNRCAPIFLETIEKSENNPNCLSHIGVSLKAIIIPLDDGCLKRELLPLYTDFIGKFLAFSVYPVMAEGLRMELLQTCREMIYKFEPVAQVLIIRRLIDLILRNKYENILEPQCIAWLLDCYRTQLGKYKCFANELGYLWADLTAIKYENMHEAVNFYAALMILAQYQALLKINKPLLRIVKQKVIDPLKSKIAEWSHLMEINKSNESQTVPYLQSMMSETCRFISLCLSDNVANQQIISA